MMNKKYSGAVEYCVCKMRESSDLCAEQWFKKYMLNTDEIVFVINQQERIKIVLPCELDEIFKFHYVDAIYIKDNICERPLYLERVFINFVEQLHYSLQDALAGKSKLDKSLQENIGYLWNDYLNQGTRSRKKMEDWIGEKYLMCESSGVSSWLYEKNGKFFLEITPVYKWHSRYPEKEEKKEYIPYQQFIKDYKSYCVIELSGEIMREWLKQTEFLLNVMYFNDDKYYERHEEPIINYLTWWEEQENGW